MLIQKAELVDQYEGLLCWFLLDFWQTSFKISPSYTLFGISVFRNSGWSPDLHLMLHWATLLLSGMQDKKMKVFTLTQVSQHKNSTWSQVIWKRFGFFLNQQLQQQSFHVPYEKYANIYWFWLT